MPRTSPVHYIAPSAISITPNCNSSANDLAVYMARDAKIRVFSKEAGIDYVNADFQQWTLKGRNRRLSDSAKPYTIYARLHKTDHTDGYLVFAAKNQSGDAWYDKYAYVTLGGIVTPEGATVSDIYYYIRIGDVSLPENGQRTLTYDTGILGTDQYNTDWIIDPDLLKRIMLQCSIDGRDAGSTPYVPWEKDLVLTAQMASGWFDPEILTFDHWTLVRDTGDADADAAWLQKQAVQDFAQSGTITLSHPREGDDDFNGTVSSVFKVTAYGKTADGTVKAIAATSISMMAETIETYSLGLSTVLVSYNPQTKTYNPDGGVQVRVRANDQRGNLLRITNQQYELLNLQLQYKRTSQQQFTNLPIDGGAPTDLAVATIPITAFQAQESLELRLINTEQKELAVSTIAFVRDGEDSKEREWIFLRSSQAITFGDITSEHPLPSLIPGGEVSPHGIAGGDDYNKQQDDWVPEGWTDDSLGTDEDMPYEYGSYRDYVHGEGEEAGHWGDFVTPRVWSHYGEDAITYDIIPAASVISASNSGVISMSGLAVKAYRIKGLDRSDNILPEGNPPASGDYYYAEYSVDGGSYVPCEGLPDGAGYGIGATALQATRESVIFRLKHTSAPDVVLKESLPINVVRSMSEDWIRNNFLSKVNDDTAEGVITFKKGFWVKVKELFGFTADGDARMRNGDVSGTLNVASDTAIGGDTTIGGTLRTNDIRSDNYTGDGMADTGFRLTKDDGTGSSKLTTDILYVRKKAVFEEVEVKKETAIAGNQIYSSAANIILRTDYFDASGNLMGYSVVQVPWMLKNVPFLLRILSRLSRTGFFGRQRRIRMFLEAADIPKIRRVRCYFLAKDDEREIKNLWRVEEYYPDDYPDVSKRGQLIPGTGNDLARCQTMNLSNSNRTTYIHGMETKAGNVYWWRKLCGVSTQPVQGDDGREYHYFDVMFDYDAEAAYRAAGQQCPWCDVASGDIPAAGDHVVQFGNDMNPDRMNLIAVEINGDDSPATKYYRGIYTFDLSRCWWGGSPRKEMISAASGVEFYGPSFNVQTEYGVAKVPKDRNEVNWSDIARQRDDYGEHPDVRKLYYYDAVTHGGCRWLCLVPEGMHWVRPQVWDDDAYKIYDDNHQYRHNGNYITDVQYTALTTDQKTQCGHIPNYTTTEPGTDANIWKKIVDKGANSVRIDLDNENDSMLYSSTKGLVSGNVVSTGVLFDGINDVSASATWSIQATNCTATLTGRTVTVTAMSAATGSVVVRALYNGQTYTATLTLKKILDGDKFDLVVTPNSIAYNSTTDTPATSTLAIQVWKTACDGTRALSAPPSGYDVYANGNKLTASSTGTYSYTTDNSAISEVTVKIATSASATDSLDAETIPVNKAANGANAVRIDLDNENDAMLYSSSKGLVSGNVTSTAHLYDGTSDVSASATWSITNSNCTATISNRVITVTAMSAATGSVTVSAQYNGKTYTAILTLKKILDADKYDLVVTPNSIAYNSTTDTPATSTLAIQVWKTACDGTRALSAPPSGYKVFANGNALTASSTGTYSYTTDNSAISEVTVKIATSASATDSLDAETIPVNKAANGASITKKSETYRYAANNTGTRPAASSSDWKTTKPTLQKGYWLYTETTITWSDNSTTVLYTDERNPNDGVNGQDIIVDGATVMKYYVGDSNTTHPADTSSDWKDLSQVTQTQGKWLWSQATTYYRKASSAAGSHDAGTSYNYNVSYISKDGKTGRGISSITEYYQATNSSAARPAPTSATGWSTDPNLSDLTDKWDQNHKYLWNMEETVYSNVDGTTTTTYSIPQIVAIWTKDGAAGKGIDSIVNYYKITSTSTAPSKPSTPGTDGWTTTPGALSTGQYLWNYERITWINPSSTTETDVQMIGYAGTNGQDSTVPGPPGDDGDDGWTIIANPANVILTQSLSTTSSFSTADVSFSAKKGSRTATVSNLTGISEYHFDVTKTGNSSIRVNYPKQSGSSYYTEGYFEVDVTATDPDTGNSVTFSDVRVLCYANLLGSWKETVTADARSVAASQAVYEMDDRGVPAKNTFNYTAVQNAASSYESWSSGSGDGSKSDMINKTTTAQTTADGAVTKVDRVTTTTGNVTKIDKSQVTQYADEINADVITALGETGIHINGTNRNIDLIAGKVSFRNSSDTAENSYFSVDSDGKMTASGGGKVGGFEIGTDTLGSDTVLDSRGYAKINRHGILSLYNHNTNDDEALNVNGGAEILGSSGKPITLANNSGAISVNGNTLNLNTSANNNNQVNIGSSATASVNINGSAANFGSSTPVSVGSSLAVQGMFILSGDTTFITNNRSTAKTVALPSNASRGQVVFAKGTVGNLTLTGSIRNDEGSIVSSIGGDKRSRIFIYGDSYWNEFYCS